MFVYKNPFCTKSVFDGSRNLVKRLINKKMKNLYAQRGHQKEINMYQMLLINDIKTTTEYDTAINRQITNGKITTIKKGTNPNIINSFVN